MSESERKCLCVCVCVCVCEGEREKERERGSLCSCNLQIINFNGIELVLVDVEEGHPWNRDHSFAFAEQSHLCVEGCVDFLSYINEISTIILLFFLLCSSGEVTCIVPSDYAFGTHP